MDVPLTLFLSACGEEKAKKSTITEVKPLSVNVHTLKKESYPIWVYFSGKTQAVDEVMVVSRVTGEIESILFSPGESQKRSTSFYNR